MESSSKDIWDKLTATSALLASVLVPIAVAVVGNAYTSALKESETRLKYTEIAVAILKERPLPDTQNVRGWAVDVLNKYSGVPIDQKAREELLRVPIEQVEAFVFDVYGPGLFESLIDQPRLFGMIRDAFAKGTEQDQKRMLKQMFTKTLKNVSEKRKELLLPLQQLAPILNPPQK